VVADEAAGLDLRLEEGARPGQDAGKTGRLRHGPGDVEQDRVGEGVHLLVRVRKSWRARECGEPVPGWLLPFGQPAGRPLRGRRQRPVAIGIAPGPEVDRPALQEPRLPAFASPNQHRHDVFAGRDLVAGKRNAPPCRALLALRAHDVGAIEQAARASDQPPIQPDGDV
jgi:hypothetical protein